MEWMKGQIDVIAGTTWWPGQGVRGERRGCESMLKESTRAAKWKQGKGEKRW